MHRTLTRRELAVCACVRWVRLGTVAPSLARVVGGVVGANEMIGGANALVGVPDIHGHGVRQARVHVRPAVKRWAAEGGGGPAVRACVINPAVVRRCDCVCVIQVSMVSIPRLFRRCLFLR